jgi:hypothetical protein
VVGEELGGKSGPGQGSVGGEGGGGGEFVEVAILSGECLASGSYECLVPRKLLRSRCFR